MPHPHVVVERSTAGYLRVLLSRPERRNALDAGMVTALAEALTEDPLETVLLGSTDPAVFCAGADLTITDAERGAVSDLLYACFEVMITRPGPVLAVLSGPAVAGGAQLAAAADFRFASPDARLRWIGPPGAALAVGAWILPDLVGRAATLELTATGRWVDAAEALALGLVTQIDEDPGQAAARMAGTLAAAPGGTAKIAKVKQVTAAGGLLERLRAERDINRAAFDETIARTPT
jgi:enoyl-CoA hydratase/carnithine racemase